MRAQEDSFFPVPSFQMLYADSYLTEPEFEAMFDHSLYKRVRQRYACEQAFPSIYEKVNRNARNWQTHKRRRDVTTDLNWRFPYFVSCLLNQFLQIAI